MLKKDSARIYITIAMIPNIIIELRCFEEQVQKPSGNNSRDVSETQISGAQRRTYSAIGPAYFDLPDLHVSSIKNKLVIN